MSDKKELTREEKAREYKDKLIKEIPVIRGNLSYVEDSGVINGSLLGGIQTALDKYAEYTRLSYRWRKVEEQMPEVGEDVFNNGC